MAGRTALPLEKHMRRSFVVRLITHVVIIGLAELGTLVGLTGAAAAQQPPPARKAVTVRVADSTQVQVIRLRDGSSIVGRVTEVGTDTIRFAATGGTLLLTRADIVDVRDVAKSSIRGGEVWPANPNATRLFFAPTGRMLAKGEGYFNDTYLLLLSVQGGVSSRFNLGGGLSVVPVDNFTDNALFVTPKIGVVASPKFNLAVGALAGFVGAAVDEGDDASFGILYGVGTIGSPDASITFGTGLAYAGGQFADRPVAMLGAESRLGRRVSFVTENYLIPSDDVQGVISYGLRFYGEKLSTDVAFWNAPGNFMVFPGIPYVAISVKF
jgi:hypothetical protein